MKASSTRCQRPLAPGCLLAVAGLCPVAAEQTDGDVACVGPIWGLVAAVATRLFGPGIADRCWFWFGVCLFLRPVMQKRAPELALSLFCLLLRHCSVAVALPSAPARDKQAPCHPQGYGQEDGASGAPATDVVQPLGGGRSSDISGQWHGRTEGHGAGRPGWCSTLFCPRGERPSF